MTNFWSSCYAVSRTFLIALTISSCAADRYFQEADRQVQAGNFEQAIKDYERAIEEGKRGWSNRSDIRAELLRKRLELSSRLITQAQQRKNTGDLTEAENLTRRALTIDPSNERGSALLVDIDRARSWDLTLEDARSAIQTGELERAETLIGQVLAKSYKNPRAMELKRALEEKRAQAALETPRLRNMYAKPITVEFKDANIKQIFEAFSRTTGINFIMDKDVRGDAKTTIFLKNSAFEDAIELILVSLQLEKRVLNQNTVLIYPAGGQKRQEYQDLLLRVFYLNNADAKTTALNVKTMLKLKDVLADEKLNAVYIRDTPDTILLAERFIALQDLAEPEVMLEVEVLEISSSRLLELGIQYPSQLAFSALSSAGKTGAMLIDDIRGINRSRIETTIPGITLNLRKSDGASTVLANPRIRVRNREKAKILIGDKVPVITTTTSQGVVAENIQYLEVGIKLEVEPNIYLRDDVGIKVALEVSSLAREIRSPSGALAYQIGTRSATTSIRLREGETQILGGLISNEERTSAARIPGLGDLPLLGRLFSTQKDDAGKSEILLAITPRLIRNFDRPDPKDERMWTGSESQIRLRPLLLPEVFAATDVKNAGGAGSSARSAAATDTLPVSIGAGAPIPAAQIPEAAKVNLQWVAPAQIKASENFQVSLLVDSDGGIQSMPMQIGFDRQSIEVLAVNEGDVFKKDGGGTNFSSIIDTNNGIVLLGYARTGTITPTNKGTVLNITARFLNGKTQSTLKLLQVTPIVESGRTVPITLPPTFELKITP
jgi:general secretion pathway protein D